MKTALSQSTAEGSRTSCFYLLGINPSTLTVPSILIRSGSFLTYSDSGLRLARKWKTLSGIYRFVEKEKAAGSNWTYSIFPVWAVEVGK